jgi:adenylylsulfate kinase
MLSDCACTCPGATVWLAGPSEAARTEAAYMLAERLRAEHRRAEVLDGHFGDSGRAGLTAEVLARNGIVAIVPCAESVDAVRERHEASGTRYVEVRVAEHGAAEESAAAAHARLVARSR